jgi:type IV secretion system protein VirB10
MAEAVIDAGRLLDERAAARSEATAENESGDGIAGERGAVDLKGGRKAAARGARAFVAVIVGVGALIAIVITAKAYHLSKTDPAKAKPTERVEKKVRALKLDQPLRAGPKGDTGEEGVEKGPRVVHAAITGMGGLLTPGPAVAPAAGGEGAETSPPSPTLAAPAAPPAPPAQPHETVQDRRLGRGFGGTAGDEGGLAPPPQPGPEAPSEPATVAKAGGFEEKLEPTELRATSAAVMKDRDYWLTQGATLDCVLQTKIISTVPGMVSCYLTRNVYSTNGHVVLLDRGSKLVGRYQSGVQQGEARIFVVWTRAETPNGVVVNLDSPGTGALGEAGVGGWADTHFWGRFGAAIMVSMIQSGTNAVAARLAGAAKTTSISVQGPASAANDVVGKTYDSTINMPPTIYVNQGERISIFVARDLNFRNVYGLEPVSHDEQ